MPTTIPDRATRARQPDWHICAKFARLFATLIYLLLLTWNVSALEADFASIVRADNGGNYNPREPLSRERFALGPLEIR